MTSPEGNRERRRGDVLIGRLLEEGRLIRIMEVHSALAAMVVEGACVSVAGSDRMYDGHWLSSLADSSVRGVRDNEFLGTMARITSVIDILQVTTRPVFFDGNTGGTAPQFARTVRVLGSLGVDAIVIEDKAAPKENSLLAARQPQRQLSKEEFAAKVSLGKEASSDSGISIIARLESLVVGEELPAAIERARMYRDAGADALVLHAIQKDEAELCELCCACRREIPGTPILVVPTAYPQVEETTLVACGVRGVIYANHLVRSSHRAMSKVAETILRHERALEAEGLCTPIQEFLNQEALSR